MMTSWLWVVAISSGVLLWTWILYPIVMWLVSRGFSVSLSEPQSPLPVVTAVLATRDDVETIAARVEDFFTTTYPLDRLSVVVGVDAATPAMLDAIRTACGSRPVVITQADAPGGKPSGLNAAVRSASGDILVFSDAQQRFAPDAIGLLVDRLRQDSRLAAVGGALQLPGDRPGAKGRSPVEWYWAMERQLRAAEARVHSSVGLSGSIYAMWRHEWQPMPDHLILDDVWLPMRLVLRGRRVGYDLAAHAWDARRTNVAQERLRKVRTLTGNFQLIAWLPSVLMPIRNPIWLQFVSHKVCRLFTPWMVLALMIGCAGAMTAWVPPAFLSAVLISILAGIIAISVTPKARTMTIRALSWGWSLQMAVAEATVNGLRGRWNVWR